MSLTVMVITYNEAPNIERCLRSVDWAKHILVVDSYSDDATLEIVRNFPQAQIVQREFDTFAAQCNFGLSQVKSDWTLSLDADYVLPDDSEGAILAAIAEEGDAWMAGFDYWVHGKPVFGSILPGRVVLYRTQAAEYRDDGHGHRVHVNGVVKNLPFRIAHDDRKPLSRWLESQLKYAWEEADKLCDSPRSELGRNDRIRRWIVFAPGLVFMLIFFLRGGLFSGWRGFYYAMQRMTAETLLSLNLLERKLGWDHDDQEPNP